MFSSRHASLTLAAWLAALAGATVCLGLEGAPGAGATADESFPAGQLEFFESRVRPILIAHCQECHGTAKQESGLALTSREAAIAGGFGGPAVVPGRPDESLLVDAIRHDGLEMPPAGRLADEEIAVLEQWVRDGAAWTPGGGGPLLGDQEAIFAVAAGHWAFQQLHLPPVPQVQRRQRVRTPVDAFILERLEAAGLEPAAAAPPQTLIRRLSFDLLGLPPTADEVEAFVAEYEAVPHADVPRESLTPAERRLQQEHRDRVWESLVERMLASPHYGERWGRHWLDVARYADTRDFIATGADRRYPFAWTYRDWVVRAFNDDMPFDRFVRLQIAADFHVADAEAADLAALGLLTVGPRFINKADEQIADRIDVVGRGFLGLTISCARCHDHKYDPIPTADYYGLYGVFASCEEPKELPRIAGAAPAAELVADYEKVRAEKRADLAKHGRRLRDEAEADFRSRPADYLAGYHEMKITRQQSIRGLVDKRKLKETAMTPLADNLGAAVRGKAWRRHAVLGPLVRLLSAGDARLAAELATILAEGGADPLTAEAVSPLVRERLAAAAPADTAAVLAVYGGLFAEAERRWQEAVTRDPGGTQLDDPAWEQVRRLLHEEPGSPFRFEPDRCLQASRLLGGGRRLIADLENAVQEIDATHPGAPPRSFVLVDKPKPVDPVVFLRGEPRRRGPQVTRHFLTVLGGGAAFSEGSGRRELADAIAAPDNPLTARVFVNRVWAHLLGRGLVETASDFGLRTPPPSHPELLDWLAATFVADGWSVKNLQRRIVLSATYRQRSVEPRAGGRPAAEGSLAAAVSPDAAAATTDPANQLLARANRRRLDFESMRDAMLMASGDLDTAVGGRSVSLSTEPFSARRTLYGFIDRLNLDPMFTTFDFASPDVTAAERPTTMVPQQALFAMNHPFVIERARAICRGEDFLAATEDEARAAVLYRRIFARQPTSRERQLTVGFVRSTPRGEEARRPVWQYGHGDPAVKALDRFVPFEFFDGANYQLGPEFPDPRRGHLRLSATGGHPGRTSAHPVIRRWTAPVAGTVSVSGTLEHLRDRGDGVRGRVLDAAGTVLGEWTVFNDRAETVIPAIEVRPGDVLDFAVDCRENASSDAFSWAPQIDLAVQPGGPPRATSWTARQDFAGPPPPLLSPWEQIAQALLLTNEFWFID
jgi:mono/diheme cytochrome c family protein